MDKFFTQQPPPRPKPDPDPDPKRDEATPAEIPRGVVVGKDGKPCRTCTPFATWAAAMRKPLPANSASSTGSTGSSTDSSPPSSTDSSPPFSTDSSSPSSSSSFTTDPSTPCPPDIAELGSHSWTLLHSISATYPETASASQQRDMRRFLRLFAGLYPCGTCGDDFAAWMEERGNEPRVGGREGFGRWMCEAHNEVNRKTGKELFDCGRWEERWRTGAEGC